MMDKNKKPKCYNCKHSGTQFKCGSMTSMHCEHPKENPEITGIYSAWETLRSWYDTCEDHEFKECKPNK